MIACNLKIGDALSTTDNRWIPIDNIRRDGSVATVYNMTVRNWHTYFVGEPSWGFDIWVHNNHTSARIVVDAETDEVFVFFNNSNHSVSFKNVEDAEAWIVRSGHTLHQVSPIPPHDFPGTQTVDINKIRPSAEALSQRGFAAPHKLDGHGFFDWNKYNAIEAVQEKGQFIIDGGLTRLENARRFGVTHLPIVVRSSR